VSTPSVETSGLTKTYRVYAKPLDRLREAVSRQRRHREFHALSDVSFATPAGESLGLIGENGSGKSTLLKILAGITQPSAGSFRVGGKVASILELGSGFHPEFTGRQNIVLNAALLGLSAREVRARTPAIIDFSELGDYIEQPVKTYSTGMAMRLGFSIATQVDPDVLIIDEALSVGDGYFQKKCMDRLVELVGTGKTLLFCTHAMYYVSAFCQRALWLRKGRVEALGPAVEVVREYENYLLHKGLPETPADAEKPVLSPSPARITAVRVPAGGAATARFRRGDTLEIEVEWQCDSPGLIFNLGIGVNRNDGLEVCSFATHFDGVGPFTGQRRYRARLRVPNLPLVKGEFMLYVFLLDDKGLHIYDQQVEPRAFEVDSADYRFGLLDVAHAWEDMPASGTASTPVPMELVKS
jgi:ABC-type polysaccharide/polyol phosphate transport system ATPase subunit